MRLRSEEAALGRAPLQKEKRDTSTTVGMTEEMRRAGTTEVVRLHGEIARWQREVAASRDEEGTMYRAPTGDSGGERQNQHPRPCPPTAGRHNPQGWGTQRRPAEGRAKKIEGATAVRLLHPLN